MRMRLVGHMLNHMLDYIIVDFVTPALYRPQ